MHDYVIPLELIDMLKQRRVIPFIGAGFSFPLAAPSWGGLLEQVASEVVEDLTYDEIKRHCNDDFLRIAEYLMLKSDRSIGPLRHVITKEVLKGKDPVESGSHIELVNLGAPQIYTTNYDEGIEAVYSNLGEEVEVVVTPEHVARMSGQKIQLVKFHGDLRYDESLVLTESSYYARLDFETPLDVKFRSDILGKSVLFMGYSFNDLNIRIVWYKLMRMMKDIHYKNRPKSFLVQFEPNPVLQELNDEVGITTIVLDPRGVYEKSQWNDLFADFLMNLVRSCAEQDVIPGRFRIPGAERYCYVSTALVREIRHQVDLLKQEDRPLKHIRSLLQRFVPQEPQERQSQLVDTLIQNLRQINRRRLPIQLTSMFSETLTSFADLTFVEHLSEVYSLVIDFALKVLRTCKSCMGVTDVIVTASSANAVSRELVLKKIDTAMSVETPEPITWNKIWGGSLSGAVAANLLSEFEQEIELHEKGVYDSKLASQMDIVLRINHGLFGGLDHLQAQAESLTKRAKKTYPSISKLKPSPDKAPNIEAMILEIEKRKKESGDTPKTIFGELSKKVAEVMQKVRSDTLPTDDIRSDAWSSWLQVKEEPTPKKSSKKRATKK